MSLLEKLTGFQLLEEVQSPYSGRIVVSRRFGAVRLEVGGLLQSGSVVFQIWKKALAKAKKLQPHPQTLLVLGLGGGNCAQIASQLWPGLKITGVELDPVVIRLAKKYFDLTQIPFLKVVNADAFDFVHKDRHRYDLIVVDLYLGDQLPDRATYPSFFRQLRRRLKPQGLLVFNHLFYGSKVPQARRLVAHLDPFFSHISLKRVLSNLIIYAQP